MPLSGVANENPGDVAAAAHAAMVTTPAGKPGTPVDAEAAAVYLARHEAAFIHGTAGRQFRRTWPLRTGSRQQLDDRPRSGDEPAQRRRTCRTRTGGVTAADAPVSAVGLGA